MKTKKRLYRTRKPDRIIGGVCGGISEYFDIDPVFVRLLCVVIFLISPPTTFFTYLVAWVITPIKKLELPQNEKVEPEDKKEVEPDVETN